MDDASLVREVLDGNRAAYTQLWARYEGPVRALCLARARRSHDADDLAGEAMLRGLRDLTRLKDPARFGGWICAIARNVCRHWAADRQNGQVPLGSLPSDDEPVAREPEPAVADRAEDQERLMAAVKALPRRFREVIHLKYQAGQTYAQIARALGVRPATVNARLTFARKRLRDLLSSEDGNGAV
jgi:RNA polymerase sigma-70 factor (ECF subfamily)